MLVTIVVITYNSERYVIDTLNSAYRQTYQPLELIISDDCSSDNTQRLCLAWLNSHKMRFVRTIFTSTPSNVGICGNYNHALSLAHGEFIKYIAGDDILKDNCIECLASLVHPDVHLYFSADEFFYEEYNIHYAANDLQTHSTYSKGAEGHYNFPLSNLGARKQLRLMLAHHYGLAGPTIFVRRRILITVGGFDLRYPMCEDWTIVLKYLVHSLRIISTKERLVRWRIHSDSVSHCRPVFVRDIERAKQEYDHRYCLRLFMPFHLYHNDVERFLAKHKSEGWKARAIGYLLRILDVVNAWRKMFPPHDVDA